MTDQAKRELRKNLEAQPPEDRWTPGSPCCTAQDPDGYGCTKDLGHAGDHVAHGILGQVIRRWPQDPQPKENKQ